jgi:hypothetical protein
MPFTYAPTSVVHRTDRGIACNAQAFSTRNLTNRINGRRDN